MVVYEVAKWPNLRYVLSNRLAGVLKTEQERLGFLREFLADVFQRARPCWEEVSQRVRVQRVSWTGRVYYIGTKLNQFKDAGSRTLTAGATWRVNIYNAKLHFIVSGCNVMEITIDFCAVRGSIPPLIWRKILRLESVQICVQKSISQKHVIFANWKI